MWSQQSSPTVSHKRWCVVGRDLLAGGVKQVGTLIGQLLFVDRLFEGFATGMTGRCWPCMRRRFARVVVSDASANADADTSRTRDGGQDVTGNCEPSDNCCLFAVDVEAYARRLLACLTSGHQVVGLAAAAAAATTIHGCGQSHRKMLLNSHRALYYLSYG